MAAPSHETEILKEGVDSRTPSNSSFALNMIYRRGAWEVRDGFGQVSQRTTSFSMPFPTASEWWGIREHLGSTVMQTNYGHTQVVSLFTARVNTSNTTTTSPTQVAGPFNYNEVVTVVHIEDLTDRTHWEEVLYQHTSVNEKTRAASQLSQDSMGILMAYWHGNYESASDKDRQSWSRADEEKPVFFHEYRDALFFGSEDMGTWVYYPSHFRHSKVPRSVQTDTHLPIDAIGKYSESSRVSRVAFTEGVAKGYPYFTSSTLPNFADATSSGGTMVYAGARRLYFSDPELPASIVQDNYVFVPCEGEITAIEEQLGNILVFTESETFLYRMPSSAIRSGGTFTQLSNSVGCVGAQAVSRVEGDVYWISRNGIYATSGNLVLEKVGAPVERFFTDYMTNPLTSFYPKSGMMDASNIQPQTTLQADLSRANLCYCSRYGVVLATFPGNNASLVFSGGKWSVWTYESIAFSDGGAAEVGTTRNITSPWLVATPERIWAVGSTDEQTISGLPVRSYYLTEYGRGGAVDRSVDDEDMRGVRGLYEIDVPTQAAAAADTFLIYGKPFLLEPGYKFRGNQPILQENEEVWVVPVYAQLNYSVPNTGVTQWQSHFTFNNTDFRPITTVGNVDIDFMLPSERVAGEAGYTYGAGVAGRRVQLNAVGGNTVYVEFDATAAASPHINSTPFRATPLLYLPFARLDRSNTSQINISPVVAPQFFQAGLTVWPAAVVSWVQTFIGTSDKRFENSVVQPVDWAYKSAQIGQADTGMFLARGLYSLMLSRGDGLAADYAVTDWDAGLFNTLVSVDRKGWMSQIIDYVGTNADAIERITNKGSIRTRQPDW